MICSLLNNGVTQHHFHECPLALVKLISKFQWRGKLSVAFQWLLCCEIICWTMVYVSVRMFG